jgi:membrane protein
MFEILKETVRAYGEDNAPLLAAALAFFSIFSLAPLLLILTSVLVFLGASGANEAIMGEIEQRFGAGGVAVLEDMIASQAERGSGTFAALVGAVTLFVGGTTLFAQLERALNVIWGVQPKRRGALGSARHVLTQRIRSLGLILAIVTLVLVAAFLSTYVSSVLESLAEAVPGGAVVWAWLNQLGVLVALSLVFAITFTLLPNVAVPRTAVAIGAPVTAVLFMGGSWLFGLYVSNVAIGNAYGVAGSLVVLLLWVYVSAHTVLLGAEFTKAVAGRVSGERGAPPTSDG